jgi:MFS family permease
VTPSLTVISQIIRKESRYEDTSPYRRAMSKRARRWAVLIVGMTAMVAVCAFAYGLPFLLPALRASGLTLTRASLLISAPIAGVLCSLVIWGAITDRVGERRVLLLGLSAAAGLLVLASRVPDPLLLGALLVAAGAASSCVHVASGRLILGWFPPEQRGVAMGLRQTAQPLGVALAAVALPPLGERGLGPALAFLAGGVLLAVVLILLVVQDPDAAAAADAPTASPYGNPYLWRVHVASSLLVVPQFTVGAFAFDYLVHDRAWDAGPAGAVLAAAGLAGGGMRLAAGWWSDRVRSRLRPMRLLSLGTSAVLFGLAAAALRGAPVAAPLLAFAAVVTVSTNGLSFTAVAERAGRFWAGRALGVQNTVQNLAAVATAPAVALVVSAAGPALGYAAAFAAVVAFPLVAAAVVPVAGERAF